MKSVFLTGILTLGCLAQAKTLHQYQTQVQAKNRSGKVVPALVALAGWSCHSEMRTKVVESQPDHKGKLKEVVKEVASDFRYMPDVFGQARINKPMIVNHGHDAPKIQAVLAETCTQSYQKKVYDNPSTPEDESGYETATRTLNLNWRCQIDGSTMPKAVGEKQTYSCHEGDYFSSDGSVGSHLIAQLKDKQIDVTLQLDQVKETAMDYFNSCDGRRDSEAVIINLKQGVVGHIGENDFVFNVSLDGGEKLKLNRDSGLLSEDIKYCPPDKRGNVAVKVEAIEEDFPKQLNDHYRSQEINVSAKGGQGSISLDRKNIFGKPKYQSSIVVGVRPYQAAIIAPPSLRQGGASADWAR